MEYCAKEVGERLRMLRKHYGYSREKIAESIGRSVKYYADIERGTCGMSLETLIALADFYRVSLDYLVEGTDHAEKESMDEETKWAVKRLCGLNDRRRKIVVEMVSLMVEQAEGR